MYVLHYDKTLHLRTQRKYRKQKPQASVSYISREFSNVLSILSQCTTRLRLLHLLYVIEVLWQKTIKHAFSMSYTLIKHGCLTNKRAHRVLSMLQSVLKMCIPRGTQCLVLIEIIVYATYSLYSEIQLGCNIQFYKPNSLALAVLGLYSSAKDLPRINLKNAAFLPDEEKKIEKKRMECDSLYTFLLAKKCIWC